MLESLYYEHIHLHFQVHLLNASLTGLYKNQVHQEALYHNCHSHMLALYHESPGPTKYSYHRLLNINELYNHHTLLKTIKKDFL